MAPSIRLTCATLNDAAFALLEQYANGEITDTAALTKIDVELDVAGIPFNQEEWLDLIKVILMSPTEGLNSIKAARQLMQAKVVPLLEDAAAWQLVLWWAGDNSFSFDSFLQEMQDRFKERYKFDDWKTIFDQVFEASCEGTAVKLVRAAMSERGVLNPPSVPDLSSSQALSSGDLVDNASHTIPSTQASSLQTCKVSRKSDSSLPLAKHARLSKSVAWYLDVSMREDEDDENEDGDQDNLDIGVENHPKVMEVGPSGRATFNEHLQDLVQRYAHEGGVAGSNVRVRQNQVPNVEVSRHVDVGQSGLKVFMIELPTASAARFVLEHLKLENLPCRTFHSLPKCIFVEAHNLLEVQICLPPSHNTLIKNIVLIPAEEMRSITQPHDIPIRSWVCHLSSPFKNDISYVLSTNADSMEMLVVPREVPYYSTPQDLFHGRTLFDVDLARVHGLEVTVSTDEEVHLVASCEGREYHRGCTRFFSRKKAIKVVNVPLPDEIAWFALALIDPPLVDHTMTSFSAQWWQDRDTGRICSGEYAGSLAHVIVMDSQCESVTVRVLIPGSSDDVVKDLEISIHNFRLEFLPGTFVKVIAGMNHGFEGMVIGKVEDMVVLQGNDQQASHCLVKWIVLLMCLQLEVPEIFLASHVSPMMYTSRDPHDQLFHDPLANKSCIQLGDLVWVVSGPHKGLSGTLHYHSGHEILITPSTLPQESTDNPGNKGKSKAQESEVAGGDGGIDENSDLIQVSVSIDDAIIIPPPTLQLSKERGYDVSISNCVQVARGPAVGAEGPVCAVDFASGHLTVLSEDGPWHDVPISFCVKGEDYTLCDQEYHVGCKVWIISGPSKGYRGMLRSLKNTAVVTESGMLLNGTPLDSTRMAAFIALRQNLFAEIAPPPHRATPPPSLSAVDPLAEPGPSTSTSNPWIVNADDVATPRPNETEKQQIDYGT
ncbi:hypothetical protein PISMIDRAFT_17673 [Pisolithus microcarpus 441]|uniref:KOW domain-containing protein n=1 Tax=Pisolithus microcarpus 441 TaxID=765257 RepID=A0A0C9YJA3_9AGAM|nr:hypothetical protein BKA83DRAFT_17673 [Pisolithus microcarpus]KIK13884.1 hypothetical protein PISMIDRAFT_17673 [Pisolithus microcarpus 441]